MAAISPLAARLFSSLRASQQATPRESSAAPAIRATIPPGVFRGGPSSKESGSAGDNASAKPVAPSITAVTTSRVLIVVLLGVARAASAIANGVRPDVLTQPRINRTPLL